jgi:hypothetical protein
VTVAVVTLGTAIVHADLLPLVGAAKSELMKTGNLIAGYLEDGNFVTTRTLGARPNEQDW